MFENFGLGISKIFKSAELIRYDLRHPYVGSEHLLLAILKDDNKTTHILNKYGVTYTSFKKELLRITNSSTNVEKIGLYTPLLKRIIENALMDNDDKQIDSNKLLLSLLEEADGIALRVLLLMDIDIEKLYEELKQSSKNNNIIEIDYGVVLNDTINNEDNVVCRDKEIKRVIETLLRHKKNNPLLIGKAGVGKTAIVEELARRINKKEVPEELYNSKIVMLEMGSLVAGTKYRGEFEEKLNKIIECATKDDNIILFIDEIHTMINAGAADGAVSAANILKPYLARGNIKMIGATTTNEYNKYFYKDKALTRRFETIMVNEPTIEETKIILNKIKKEYEKYHNIKITSKNIEDIINLSDKYIHDKCNPDKSIELLDSVCAMVKNKSKIYSERNMKLLQIINKKEKYIKNNDFAKALKYKTIENDIKNNIINNSDNKKISKEDILSVIEEKSGIPLTKDNKEILKELKYKLKDNIVGQDDVIDKIINNLLIKKDKVKSLLFIGSTGVGKTKIAKIISENYNLIKLDMNEYNNELSINKLIGNNYGYDNPYIFEKVREKPYSLILIDEIEKAHPKVLNLFLNILDEGIVKDSHNEEINFNNCLIIATGNIKTDKDVGFLKNKNNLDKYLSKELVARFDDVISFNNLNKDDISNYLSSKYKLNNSEINNILNESDYVRYGFRDIINNLNKTKCLIDN